jgi:hypothetical protein
MEFNNGKVIEFDRTWDKEKENPLNGEYSDKGDFYVINKKYLKDFNYEEYKNEEEYRLGHYCKVPKIDIKKIYSTSEEKMV